MAASKPGAGELAKKFVCVRVLTCGCVDVWLVIDYWLTQPTCFWTLWYLADSSSELSLRSRSRKWSCMMIYYQRELAALVSASNVLAPWRTTACVIVDLHVCSSSLVLFSSQLRVTLCFSAMFPWNRKFLRLRPNKSVPAAKLAGTAATS